MHQMEWKTVTSPANTLVKRYAALLRAQQRAAAGLFLAEGASLVRECVNERIAAEALFVQIGAQERHADLIESARCAVVLASDAVLAKLSSLKSAPDIIAGGRYIVGEQVQDPTNTGAVIRSAAAFRMDGVVLCGGCDPFSPKVLRGSMGAVFKVPLHRFDSFEQAALALHERGLALYAAMLDRDAARIDDVRFEGGGAVVVGNEGAGLSARAAALCDGRVYIPIAPQVESLNAAVAASIFMWEMSGRDRG